MLFVRKKYIKNCQIRYTYGEDSIVPIDRESLCTLYCSNALCLNKNWFISIAYSETIGHFLNNSFAIVFRVFNAQVHSSNFWTMPCRFFFFLFFCRVIFIIRLTLLDFICHLFHIFMMSFGNHILYNIKTSL